MAPAYLEAGIALKQVVVDGGPEFKGAFARTCARLGISVHRIPPRSPDLNAFVERFQGTVLHLHYRTAFRYRFYTSAADIDADLAAWLRFYNFERPHRGYRKVPAAPAPGLARATRAAVERDLRAEARRLAEREAIPISEAINRVRSRPRTKALLTRHEGP